MKSSDYKQIAKDSLRGSRFKAIIASIVASFLGASVLNTFAFSFSFDYSTEQQPPEYNGDNFTAAFSTDVDSYEQFWIFLSMMLIGIAFMSIIYSIIYFTIGSAVSVGYAQFNLDIVEGYNPKLGTLFSCFSQMNVAVRVKFLTLAYVLLGYLLFIVPGVVMTLGYSMANFVLAENPGMTAKEALKESKRIMKGHKWSLLCLNCSFILPTLLSVLTLGIGFIWLLPYSSATYAAFYREAKNEADCRA